MASSNQCTICLNYIGEGVCLAFPDGIPIKVFTGLIDHTKPIKGDNGIRRKTLSNSEIEKIKQDQTK